MPLHIGALLISVALAIVLFSAGLRLLPSSPNPVYEWYWPIALALLSFLISMMVYVQLSAIFSG